MKKDHGLTLIELMISLTLATFVLALAFYIFQKQFKYSLVQESKSKLEVESYTGINLLVHDILHAGFGLKLSAKPIDSKNSSPDTLIIIGNALNTAVSPKWSVTMKKAQLSNTILVRKWNKDNFTQGDWLVILSDSKTLIAGPYEITQATDVDGPDLNGDGEPDPALRLRLSTETGVTAGKASLIFKVSPNHIADTVIYYISNGTLYRNSAPLISNVEDFEVNFLLDTDYNGIYDTWTPDISGLNAEQLRAQLGEVRFSVLVRSDKPDPSYTFPKKQIMVEDHQYEIQNVHYRRILITKRVIPRNVR